ERKLLTILLRRQFLGPLEEFAPSAEQNVIVFEKVHGSPLGARWRPIVPSTGAIQWAILIGMLGTDNAVNGKGDAAHFWNGKGGTSLFWFLTNPCSHTAPLFSKFGQHLLG